MKIPQLPDPTTLTTSAGGWLVPESAALLAGGAIGVTAPLLSSLFRSPRSAIFVVGGGALAGGMATSAALLHFLPDAASFLLLQHADQKPSSTASSSTSPASATTSPFLIFLLGCVLLTSVEKLGLAYYACRRRGSSAASTTSATSATTHIRPQNLSARERREQAGRLWWAAPQQAQPLLSQLTASSGAPLTSSSTTTTSYQSLAPPPDLFQFQSQATARSTDFTIDIDNHLSLACVIPSSRSVELQIRLDFLKEAQVYLKYELASHAPTIMTQPHRHEDVIDVSGHGSGARHTHFGEAFALYVWERLLLGALVGCGLGLRPSSTPTQSILLLAFSLRKAFERLPQLAASTKHQVGMRRVVQLVAVAGVDAFAFALARVTMESADPPSSLARGVCFALLAGALATDSLMEETLDEFTEDYARVLKYLTFLVGAGLVAAFVEDA